MRDTLIGIFEEANQRFIQNDISLIFTNVNERTLCGSLAQHLSIVINKSRFKKYYVDVEYNRNLGRLKTMIGKDEKPVTINCDIIIHSRGEIINKDNLVAIEMKKHTSRQIDKKSDKDRLIALTKDSYDDVWSFDGTTLPEHVCGYELGIYYEFNKRLNYIYLEYYAKGKMIINKKVNLSVCKL